MSDFPQPVLLGEAPSRGGDRFHHFPLSGRPARVLCELAEIPPQPEGTTYGRWTWALYEHFECRNVFARYAQATPWSAPAARDRARELLDELRRDAEAAGCDPIAVPPVVVCLGRRVQAAIGGALDFRAVRLRSSNGWGSNLFGDYGTWAAPWHISVPVARDGGAVRDIAPWLVTIPHPSGLNRLLNDPEQRVRAGDVLRQAMRLAAGEPAATALGTPPPVGDDEPATVRRMHQENP